MDDARFNDSMARMEREIDSLDVPEADRAELRRLVVETRARHKAIRDAGQAGREAARQLGEHLLEVLEGAAADASLAAKLAQFNREARERELRGEGRDHPPGTDDESEGRDE